MYMCEYMYMRVNTYAWLCVDHACIYVCDYKEDKSYLCENLWFNLNRKSADGQIKVDHDLRILSHHLELPGNMCCLYIYAQIVGGQKVRK